MKKVVKNGSKEGLCGCIIWREKINTALPVKDARRATVTDVVAMTLASERCRVCAYVCVFINGNALPTSNGLYIYIHTEVLTECVMLLKRHGRLDGDAAHDDLIPCLISPAWLHLESDHHHALVGSTPLGHLLEPSATRTIWNRY